MKRRTIEDVPIEESFEALLNAMLDNAKRIFVEEYGRDGLILVALLSSPEEQRRAIDDLREVDDEAADD